MICQNNIVGKIIRPHNGPMTDPSGPMTDPSKPKTDPADPLPKWALWARFFKFFGFSGLWGIFVGENFGDLRGNL